MNSAVVVVGHVEWVSFLTVDRPVEPGAILHADAGWDEPAGGGAAAALDIARIGGRCTLYTAFGDDAVGARIAPALAAHGVDAIGPTRTEPHRRAVTLIDPTGERTITVVGPAQQITGAELPADAFAGVDAVYFCKGDADALRAARAARVLVATARQLPVIRAAGVRVDTLVHSGRDPGERYATGDLDVAPGCVVTTDGARGGRWSQGDAEGSWDAIPTAAVDAYGAGDCFAAGLTWALGAGDALPEAVAFAATRGALALTRRGAGAG